MSTKYVIEPERATLHGHFSRDLPPCLTIDSGDTVVFQTLNAGWSVEPSRVTAGPATRPCAFAPREPEKDDAHALCSPVAVWGARLGMRLEVTMSALRVGVRDLAGARDSFGEGRKDRRPADSCGHACD